MPRLSLADFAANAVVWFEADEEGLPIWSPTNLTDPHTGVWNRGVIQTNEENIEVWFNTLGQDHAERWIWPDPEENEDLYLQQGYLTKQRPNNIVIHKAVKALIFQNGECGCGYDSYYGDGNTMHEDYCDLYDEAIDPRRSAISGPSDLD